MVEDKQQTNAATRSTLKSVLAMVGRMILLLTACTYILVFIKIILIGYLTWVGIVVGTLLILPGFISPICGLARRKRIEGFLSNISIAMAFLLAFIIAALPLWPEKKSDDDWRPYTFENELAALEAKRSVPDSENAALLYESVFNTIDANDWPESLFRKGHRIRGEFINYAWKGAEYPEISRWLDSYSETIDRLLLISGMEKCRWPVQVDICDNYTVQYEPIRRCAQLLAVAGNRDLGEGRLQKAFEKYFCLLHMAKHLYQQTHPLDFHFGFAYEDSAMQLLRYMLIQSDISNEDIDRIDSHLPTVANNWQQDTLRLLEFEKFRFANLMASVYDINERGKVRFSPSFRIIEEDKNKQRKSTKKAKLWRLYWLMNMPLDPNGVWDMAEVESIKFKRFLESGPIYDVGEDDVEPFLDFFCRIFGNAARQYASNMCFDKVTYNTFGDRYARCMTRRHGTWLIVGLRKYKNLHGHWPEKLDLISEYVSKEAFIDPLNNGSFVYKLTEENFTLYSKGINNIDEGGRSGYVRALDRNQDDITIWPLQKK